jgi:hypothetical protein
MNSTHGQQSSGEDERYRLISALIAGQQKQTHVKLELSDAVRQQQVSGNDVLALGGLSSPLIFLFLFIIFWLTLEA